MCGRRIGTRNDSARPVYRVEAAGQERARGRRWSSHSVRPHRSHALAPAPRLPHALLRMGPRPEPAALIIRVHTVEYTVKYSTV